VTGRAFVRFPFAAGSWPRGSFNLEVDRGLFPAIAFDLVLDGLSLVECTKAGPLNGRDVDEHVFTATPGGLNEAIALRRIEPLHSTFSHCRLQKIDWTQYRSCSITTRPRPFA